MATVRPPVWKGNILPGVNPSEYQIRGIPNGHLQIWEQPQDELHYAIGADCMWSLKGDDVDYDVAFVECLETAKVCAKMKGRYPQVHWAKMLAALGHHYNTCPLAPERNATTANVLMPILLGLADTWSYPNIWIRSDDVALKGYRPQDFGFLTTDTTKGEIISFCQSQNLNGAFDWADADTVDQMVAYIKDEKNKFTAPPGAHDDDLMARMITAYVAHRLRPMTDLYYVKVKRTFKFEPTPMNRPLDDEDNDEETGDEQ